MLTLSRRVGESIHIGDDITLTVSQISGKQVKLSLEAPAHLPIYRREIYLRIQDEKEKGNEASG